MNAKLHVPVILLIGALAVTFLVSPVCAATHAGPLSVSVFISPKPLIVGHSINVTAFTHGGTAPYTYAWTTSDAQSATGQKATFSLPATPGPFTINLTVTDNSTPAQSRSVSRTVTVNLPPPLEANIFISSSKPLVTGQSLNVTASAHGGTAPYTYAWTTSDSQSATGQKATFTTPSTAGPFTINLTVTDSSSPAQVVTVSKTVTVNPPPPLKANIIVFSPRPPVVGQSINVTGAAHGGTTPYTYAWTTSDSQSAAGQKATFTLPATPGPFTINLTVTDGGSPAQTVTVSKIINVNSLPSLKAKIIIVSLKPPVTGQSINVTAFAQDGTSPYTYAWTTSDSQSTTGQKAMFTTPSTAGPFTINLTVTDSSSPVKVVTVSKTIIVNPPHPLKANIIVISPKPPVTGRSINVTASVHGGTGPYAYTWITSDTQSATGQKATFTAPATPGLFTINLTVTDSGSPVQTVTATKTVMVRSPPPYH